MSSAKRIISEHIPTEVKDIMWLRNKNEPKIEPSGTPYATILFEKVDLCLSRYVVQFDKQLLNQSL